MSAKKRIIEYDIARGIGILLVIVGHEFTKGQVFSFIYSFHMALFFVLSGLVAKISCDREYFLSDKLIIWYMLWSATYLMFDICIRWLWLGELIVKDIIWNVYRSITLYGNGVLWFLPTLFFARKIGIRLEAISKRYVGLLLSILCSGIGIMGVPIIEKFNSEGVVKVLYYPLAMVLRVVIMVPFFMFGVCMKDYIMKLIKANRGRMVALGGLLIGFSWILSGNINSPVDVHTLRFGNPIVFLVLGISGSCGIIFISAGIMRLKMIGKALKFLGVNSLLIMVTHENLKIKTLIICGLKYLGVRILNQTIFSLVIVSILLLIEVIICILFAEPINIMANKIRYILMRHYNNHMKLGSEHL